MDAIAFVLKKVVSALLYPIGISATLVFIGLVTWRTKRTCGAAMVFVLIGVIFLLVMSFPITATLLLVSVEKRAGSYVDAASLRTKHIRYIVVLGGAGKTDKLSPADRTGASIFRVLEGVRLWKKVPGSKLVLSGMGFGPEANNPKLMGRLAIELGVASDSLIIKAQAWDTAQEATLFSKLVEGEPFALVTSAYHMPRAMMLFRMLGLHPIPSPCEFKAKVWPRWYRWFIPDAEALLDSTLVIHEYIGMVWAKLQWASRNRLNSWHTHFVRTSDILGHTAIGVRSR